ncbi:MAG: hypothetical protein NTX13_14695 [Acidobacteria bacterium]|jgi:hypothetical protein|nr:hypothetical protein [Acidobacteriota bacterium]
MSRGWESKDVESQQAEREWGERPVAPPTEMERRRRSLELSLTAAKRDLASARHPRHQAMLAEAVRHLESEITKLL